MAYRIKFRRDTAAQWTANNPTLSDGEPGYEVDTGAFKIGDGTSDWANLAYVIADVAVTSVDSGAGLTGGPITTSGTLSIGAGAGITVNADNVAVDFANITSDSFSEGVTNLYHTDARARSAISVSGDLSYDNTTGVISYTQPVSYWSDVAGTLATNYEMITINADSTVATDYGIQIIDSTSSPWPSLMWNVTNSQWFITDSDNSQGGTLGLTELAFRNSAGAPEANITYNETSESIRVQTPSIDYDPGRDVFVTVVNGDVAAVTQGQIVAVVGSNGGRLKVDPANVTIHSAQDILGISQTTGTAPGDVLQIITQGEITGIDTSAFVQGDTVWVDPTAPGALTNTQPAAANAVQVGYVINSAVNGKIQLLPPRNTTTTGLAEGDNQYFTDARANTAIQNYSGTFAPGNLTLTQFSETTATQASVSGAAAVDVTTATIHDLTLTGDITSLSLTGATAGTSVTLIVRQDATGGRTLTAGAGWLWAGGNNTLSTGANDVDIISVFYDGTTHYASLTTGYVV